MPSCAFLMCCKFEINKYTGQTTNTQCVFHMLRGCIDMIFYPRQIVEKVREHCNKVYMLFVDLRKAYICLHSPPIPLACTTEVWHFSCDGQSHMVLARGYDSRSTNWRQSNTRVLKSRIDGDRAVLLYQHSSIFTSTLWWYARECIANPLGWTSFTIVVAKLVVKESTDHQC